MSTKEKETIVCEFTQQAADVLMVLLTDNIQKFTDNGLAANNAYFCLGRAIAHNTHALMTYNDTDEITPERLKKLGHHCYELMAGYTAEINKLTGKTIDPLPINTVMH